MSVGQGPSVSSFLKIIAVNVGCSGHDVNFGECIQPHGPFADADLSS